MRLGAGLALLVLLRGGASAAESAAFLDIGAGARGLAMGSAYTAAAEDANALYWNPAGLSALVKREATASHAELVQGARHDYLAYAQPTSQGTFAAGVTYLSHGGLDGRDALGRPSGELDASDAAVSLGLGRKARFADLGAAVKYVHSRIASARARTFALDAGARRASGALTLGAAVRNLGPGLKYDAERDDLPLRLAAGAAYALAGGHSISAELVNGPRGAGTDGSFGGEYQPVERVFLRAGYNSRHAIRGGSGFEAARGLTLGMGFKDDRWELSYVALPMGELGNTHRFTLGARF